MFTPSASRRLTMTLVSRLPREEPRIDPPKEAMLIHLFRREFDRLVAECGIESFVAVLDAENPPHAVDIMGLHDDGADHVVDAGAESAAGDDGAAGVRGIEINVARAGRRVRSTADRCRFSSPP